MDRMLALQGWPAEQLHHGDCAVRMLTRSEVLGLTWEQQRKLTIADTGMELMRDMLEVIDARASEAAGATVGEAAG